MTRRSISSRGDAPSRVVLRSLLAALCVCIVGGSGLILGAHRLARADHANTALLTTTVAGNLVGHPTSSPVTLPLLSQDLIDGTPRTVCSTSLPVAAGIAVGEWNRFLGTSAFLHVSASSPGGTSPLACPSDTDVPIELAATSDLHGTPPTKLRCGAVADSAACFFPGQEILAAYTTPARYLNLIDSKILVNPTHLAADVPVGTLPVLSNLPYYLIHELGIRSASITRTVGHRPARTRRS